MFNFLRIILILCIYLISVSGLWASEYPEILNKAAIRGSSQVVIVDPVKNSVFKAEVTAWQKEDKNWELVFTSMDAVVGRNGIALQGKKMEGDGKTPSGIFYLGTAFGYSSAVDTKMKYRQAGNEDIWIDDINSKNYNRWVSVKDSKDAKSFEYMKRKDDLYKAGVVIEYNTDPVVKNLGSAIFLHIWRSSENSTSGCVALSESNVYKILKWLDASRKSVIVINS